MERNSPFLAGKLQHEIKKPILFVGVGQEYDDLIEFDERWFVGEIV